jgi:hypothetical protein
MGPQGGIALRAVVLATVLGLAAAGFISSRLPSDTDTPWIWFRVPSWFAY